MVHAMLRRLDQLLANLGYCSRRSARDFLKAHTVTVTGTRASDPTRKVEPAKVRIDDEPADRPDGLLVMLHKPLGLVCSHDAHEGPSIYSLIPARWRERNPQVTSVGRLDKETSGLILLTDLSPLVHRLTSPKHHVAKLYRATVEGVLSPDLIDTFANGTLRLEGEDSPCAPATLEIVSPHEALLELTEGRYRQVRRMFASVGLSVVTLHRERFGPLSLGDLAVGAWRELPLNTFG